MPRKNPRGSAGAIPVAHPRPDTGGLASGWEPVKGQWNQRDFRKAIADQVRQLNGGGLMSLLVELSLARYATVSPWGDSKPVELLETAKRYKVNADKIRKTVTAAFEEKMKSKKAS